MFTSDPLAALGVFICIWAHVFLFAVVYWHVHMSLSSVIHWQPGCSLDEGRKAWKMIGRPGTLYNVIHYIQVHNKIHSQSIIRVYRFTPVIYCASCYYYTLFDFEPGAIIQTKPQKMTPTCSYVYHGWEKKAKYYNAVIENQSVVVHLVCKDASTM